MGDPHALAQASMSDPLPPIGREQLVAGIIKFLANQDAATLEAIRVALARDIDEAGPEAMAALAARLAGTGADWDYYPRDPLARRIHRTVADHILQDSALHGMEHVRAIGDAPLVIFSNHLSYSDANLLEVLAYRAGGTGLAGRLTVIAGPKVYSSLKRRFSSLCFATIKTPQSSSLSTEDAVMNPREVARVARHCIDVAHERLRQGDALLVFAEGTRSRTTGLQQTLSAVSRYLDGPDVHVLPAGITGSEAMFPIGEDALYAVTVVARVGRPVLASALRDAAGGDRRLMMDVVGLAIAAQLPTEYRGAYAEGAPDLDEARLVFSQLFG
jgi:1-acyl-sn-glycerol-3-phosphate acyltransferase